MNFKYSFLLTCSLNLILIIQRYVEAKPKNGFFASTKNNALSEAVMSLTDCCVHGKKITILLTDEMEEDLFAPDLWRNNVALMNLFGNDVFQKHKRLRDVYVLNDVSVRQTVYPVTTAIVAVSRANRLEKILQDLKDSIWWNHEANFIIVNRHGANSCQIARIFLTITWAYNMLSVLYLCTSLDSTLSLYTFNPFTDSAPKFWNKIQDQSSDKHWTLFQSSLNEISPYFGLNGTKILSIELFFDKIKNLNGFNLKVALQKRENINRYNTSNSGYDRFHGVEFRIMCTVLHHLNATVTVKFSSISNPLDNKKLHGMAKDVIQGPVDIVMHEYMLRDFWKAEAHSFDFAFLKFVSVTIPVSLVDRLASSFSIKISISLLTIYVVFVQTLKFILKVSTPSAALEFVRIFSQSSTLKEPRSLIPRILLIVFIVTTFAFSSYVQSLLQAISTTNNQFSTIDTVDDLMNCHLPIFTTNFHKELLHEIPEGLNTVIDIESCFTRLQKGDQIVCIYEEKFIGYYLPKSDWIHVSTDNLVEKSNAYIFSEDSPLLRKFNHILLKISEGGFIALFYTHEREFHYIRENYVEKEDVSRTSDLVYLSPIFYILAASWFLGIIIFCFELLSPKIRKLKKFCRRTYVNLL